jgi:hypothetical protein
MIILQRNVKFFGENKIKSPGYKPTGAPVIVS